MEALEEKKSPKPAISEYRPWFFGQTMRQVNYYRSPFEQARDAEEQALREAKQQEQERIAQQARIAGLLQWAKDKGLLPADATELPDGDQQSTLLAQANL